MIIIDPLSRLVLFLILAFILLKVPVLGKYVSVVYTVFHEFGHALVSKLTGGHIEKIELFHNSEGVAWSSNRFWLGRVLTGLAGYPFASAISYLFLYLIDKQMYNYVYVILLSIIVFSLIFWVRNIYGLLWSVTAVGLLWGLANLENTLIIENILFLIIAVVVVEAIISSFTIFKLSIYQPFNAGDATLLWKSIIFIPAPIWGALFSFQSIMFGYLGLRIFL